MGWAPARRISGHAWLPSYLAVLLLDPYDAVRYRAQRSLQLFPDYTRVTTDPIQGATKAQQKEMMRFVLSHWIKTLSRSDSKRGAHLLIDEKGKFHEARFRGFIKQRDDQDLVLFE